MNNITEKKQYVESLHGFLAPMQDFDSIKYARTHTGAEYIRVADVLGGCAFLDITGEECGQILDNVAQIVRREVPQNVIHDIDVKRKIAPLFR